MVGIGLNVRVSPALGAEVDADGGNLRPATLDELVPGKQVSRNQLAGSLLNALYRNLSEFAGSGFAAFAPRWRSWDYLLGQAVNVSIGLQTLNGVARGIADDGALLVEAGNVLKPVFAGDVTLRRQP